MSACPKSEVDIRAEAPNLEDGEEDKNALYFGPVTHFREKIGFPILFEY